jgi:hypothetical protein
MSEYDTDIALWSEHQGNLLRRRAAGELINEADLDWLNIAEEIESLGRSDRREIRSRVTTIIEHLAKLEASPATDPRPGWRDTVIRERDAIEDLLKESPSLRHGLDAMVAEALPRGLRNAERNLDDQGERPRVALDQISYKTEQVLGPWLP